MKRMLLKFSFNWTSIGETEDMLGIDLDIHGQLEDDELVWSGCCHRGCVRCFFSSVNLQEAEKLDVRTLLDVPEGDYLDQGSAI